MAKRKSISASTRWAIFQRDGFACRYCGAGAGSDGVSLHADHVVSVADGGDNSMDNLVTACQRCNGGKAARSLSEVPTSKETVRRLEARSETLAAQVDALRRSRERAAELDQEVRDTIEAATHVQPRADVVQIGRRLLNEFGPDSLVEFCQAAGRANVPASDLGRYLNGCARKTREAHFDRHDTPAVDRKPPFEQGLRHGQETALLDSMPPDEVVEEDDQAAWAAQYIVGTLVGMFSAVAEPDRRSEWRADGAAAGEWFADRLLFTEPFDVGLAVEDSDAWRLRFAEGVAAAAERERRQCQPEAETE